MRAVRLGTAITAGAALIAIPAYAVVNFQNGAGKDQKVIHLISDGAEDGIVFLKNGSSSSIPLPGSSSIPYPGSSSIPYPGSSSSSLPGGCIFTCSGSDSKVHLPASGSSLPGNDPLGVPESSTWMMMMLGFFSIGAIRYRALRRARKVETAQQQDHA
jgi:hypothetical protein